MHVPAYAMIPFALMLLTIAVFPLFLESFWESNKNKLIVAIVMIIPTIIWLIAMGLTTQLYDTLVFDYLPFIILLGALFIITGGIFIDGNIKASPSVNMLMLAIGAVLASLMGTTGAAMLMIRPIIQTNKERKFKVHTILFSIAIIANCGGLLTPLGDPPLFMMYLRGVPFTWFIQLLPEWLFANGALLITYFITDKFFYSRETTEARVSDQCDIKPIRIVGSLNLLWLLGIILAVAFINEQTMPFIKGNHYFKFVREFTIIAMALCSLYFTKKEIRVSNNFHWGPIEEVAYLFLGIFVTMVPCILFLEQNAKMLGINTPTLFYFASGTLSSFLDNTPTAVTFYSLAQGLVQQAPEIIKNVPIIAGIPESLMKAICTASVLFGAVTYIGNGPNFMVKAIAEHEGIRMPHFFAYMYKFSLIVLVPLYVIIDLIFIK